MMHLPYHFKIVFIKVISSLAAHGSATSVAAVELKVKRRLCWRELLVEVIKVKPVFNVVHIVVIIVVYHGFVFEFDDLTLRTAFREAVPLVQELCYLVNQVLQNHVAQVDLYLSFFVVIVQPMMFLLNSLARQNLGELLLSHFLEELL